MVVVDIVAELTDVDEQALAAAARWLTDCGKVGAWIVGEPLRFDHVESVPPLRPTTRPAIAGQPHPASRVEQSLEAALARTGPPGGNGISCIRPIR